ncbi:glycosyltransferase [Pseudoflavonifractor sp. AF19-9AC]|uniref:glycosyltransferase family 4 protein n=1 Tax=Pseudoflavonifractor sp. AF19-9AC TaxID=2292244 RepID=UPI000E4D2B15|nr:glycosyltransferase family 4 protein [Pseudoflavonifractor sp. AF19-9AC]RHR05684.1 glycosyltransferase [Pseudoflavonifractor sp. AF19-9AC]
MMRVLNIISDTNIGGAGRVILNYLRYADRTQFETLVAVPRGSLLKEPLEQEGVQVYEVDGMADRSYHKDDVKVLQDLIRQVKPDLVHTHGALSGRIAAKRCHVPVVYSRHSAFPVPAKLKYPPGRWVNKLINEHYADHIIAVSPATRDNLVEGGISPKKITVVMNGIAPVPETSPEARAALRESLGLAKNTFVFGILARMEDYKGHLYLVHAAKLLKDQGRTDFRILMAGTGSFEDEVARAVVEMGVDDVVQMLGFRSDVAELLNILDVQLNASYGTEATSLALLEGMSLGLPSIVSDYGGNPFLVEHGVNGLVFPSQDSLALSKCMTRLMDHPNEVKSMGQRAKERFDAQFTGPVFARNIERIYLDVRKGDPHGTK